MQIEQFNNKYKDKGGLESFEHLREYGYSKRYIARHFGVTDSAVHAWIYMFPLADIYPEVPVSDEKLKEHMIGFAKTNSLKDFRFAFKGNKVYADVLKKVKREVYGI